MYAIECKDYHQMVFEKRAQSYSEIYTILGH